MNQGLPKGWSIEGLTIEGLSPEALLIVAIATGLIVFAAVTWLTIALWRSRHATPAEDPMAALTRAQAEAAARLEAMIGRAAEGVWLGTFHAIASRILRRHAEAVGLKSSFTILDTDDQIRLLKQIMQA